MTTDLYLAMNFLLASRRAFTPESSSLTSPPTSRPTTPIPFTLPEQGARVLELTAPIPETPQCPARPISPTLQWNAPATYKERVGIHILRHVVGLSLRRISAIFVITLYLFIFYQSVPPKGSGKTCQYNPFHDILAISRCSI